MAIVKKGDASFEDNVRAYAEMLPVLVNRDLGKYVLIGRADRYNAYPTREEALAVGYQVFGEKGFMVRLVARDDLQLIPEWLSACPS